MPEAAREPDHSRHSQPASRAKRAQMHAHARPDVFGHLKAIQKSAGNRAVSALIGEAGLPATTQPISVTRQPAPVPAQVQTPSPPTASDQGEAARLGALTVPLGDAQLREMLRLIYAKRGVAGLDEFILQVEDAVANKLDESGASDEVVAARRIKNELLDSGRLKLARDSTIDEAKAFADKFEIDAKQQMDTILASDEQATRSEALHYGLPVNFTDKPHDQPFTFTGSTTGESPGIGGLSEAARTLLRRREEIATLRVKQEMSIPPPGMDQADTAEMERLGNEIDDREVDYETLLDQYITTYPALARFTEDRQNLTGLRILADSTPAQVQEIVGREILQTLLNIRTVRQGLLPGGPVNIFKIPKMVALGKAAQGVSVGSFEARAVDDRVDKIMVVEQVTNIALGVLNLALAAAAPVTGGASLALAAGVSTATAIASTQQYLLDAAMAGSKLDRAKALCAGDPSLLWLAMDWVFAAIDLGTAAAAAGKLVKGYRPIAEAAHQAKGAQTASEVSEKLKQLETVATREGGEAFARKVVRDAERVGGVGGKTSELTADIKKVEAAADASKEALKAASTVTTETGHVHVTTSGQLFSCFNPCLDPRMRWARVLVDDADAMGKLERMERKAAESARGTMASRDIVAKEFATLDDQLARAGRRSLARQIANYLPTLAERFPILKTFALDVDAVERIVAKRTKSAIKGQLIEELGTLRGHQMIESGEIAARAGRKPELIAGHTLSERIINSRGHEQFLQFTDGVVGFRDGQVIDAVAVLEAKAGAFSASKLEAEFVSLEKISRADQRQLRIDAINEFRTANLKNERIADMSLEEIDRAFKKRIDDLVARNRITAAGQPARDMERILEGEIFETLPDGTRRKIILRGNRKTTKFIGITPSDVTVDAAGIKKRDKIDFEVEKLGIDAADAEVLVEEILQRAKGF
jgi:hypothetical protein